MTHVSFFFTPSLAQLQSRLLGANFRCNDVYAASMKD